MLFCFSLKKRDIALRRMSGAVVTDNECEVLYVRTSEEAHGFKRRVHVVQCSVSSSGDKWMPRDSGNICNNFCFKPPTIFHSEDFLSYWVLSV